MSPDADGGAQGSTQHRWERVPTPLGRKLHQAPCIPHCVALSVTPTLSWGMGSWLLCEAVTRGQALVRRENVSFRPGKT